jgi:hypothetical protein
LKKETKIIGWTVLIITEIMILAAFFFFKADKVTIIECQVGVFVTVWGSVAGKNYIDLKRDQIPDFAKEL